MNNRIINAKLFYDFHDNIDEYVVIRIPNEGNNKTILLDFGFRMVGDFYDMEIVMTEVYQRGYLVNLILNQLFWVSVVMPGFISFRNFKQNPFSRIIFGNNNVPVPYFGALLIEYFEPIVDGRSYQK